MAHPAETEAERATISLPENVRSLLDAPNYVHLSTLRRDGTPRNWVVWVGLEGDHVLVCSTEFSWKSKDMRRDPRVGLSLVDLASPYRMAPLHVIEIRPDEGCRYMDPISLKYTNKRSPAAAPTASAS